MPSTPRSWRAARRLLEGRIKEYDLETLADPKHAIPPYDAVLLLAPRCAHDAALQEALKPFHGFS